jgi:hypothetical protein
MAGGKLKEIHEISVAQRFFAVYNLGHNSTWTPVRNGQPPEPDVIAEEPTNPESSLGIEVTTAWLDYVGPAVKSVEEINHPPEEAPRMTAAKFTWERARGKNLPGIHVSDIVAQPDKQAITKLGEAVREKIDKNYQGIERIYLVVEWEYFATDEDLLREAMEYFVAEDICRCPFEQIWILARLGSQLGRQAIFRIYPSAEGPQMGPEINPAEVL